MTELRHEAVVLPGIDDKWVRTNRSKDRRQLRDGICRSRRNRAKKERLIPEKVCGRRFRTRSLRTRHGMAADEGQLAAFSLSTDCNFRAADIQNEARTCRQLVEQREDRADRCRQNDEVCGLRVRSLYGADVCGHGRGSRANRRRKHEFQGTASAAPVRKSSPSVRFHRRQRIVESR